MKKGMKKLGCIILSVFMCFTTTVPTMAASSAYRAAVSSYMNYMRGKTGYYKIIDVDGNGIPELIANNRTRGYNYNEIQTYNPQTKRNIRVAKIGYGKGQNMPFKVSRTCHTVMLPNGNTGGMLYSIYKIISKEEKTEVLSQDDEGYVIVKKGKKMLIEDFQGNTLLKGKYDSIEKIPCWPDLYKVSKEGKYGCIDKNGNVVLELQYDDFTYYDQDHLAYFEKDENGNIVGIRYEGEEEAEGTETIEGSYEITIDASNPEVVAEEIDTLYFHSDGTFNVHKIFKVSSISSPSGIVGVEWDSENTVKLSAGESSEYTDPNTYSYTIENGCINTWGQVIPVSEITQN